MVDSSRSTEEVLEDHLRCRMAGDIDADIERNYAPDVVILTSSGAAEGHEALRQLDKILRDSVPQDFEIPVKLVKGPYALIKWRARESGRSVEDGADSFVIRDGRIVFQSIHYAIQETMPAFGTLDDG
jgi:hypothetical protein